MADLKQSTGFLSLLRIFSAFAVVVIHVVSSSVTNHAGDISNIVVNMMDIVHIYMNWSVPMFFMITGYIFIGLKKNCEISNMKKYIIRFLVALFIFGFCYAMLERVYIERTINLSILIESIGDIFTGNLWDHMWYVYEIIGIYLILPIVKPFVEQSNKNLYYATIVTFIFNILLPTLTEIINVSFAFTVPLVKYMFYIFVGGMIAKTNLTNTRKCVFFSVIGILVSVFFVYIFYNNDINCSYNSVAICVLAVSIFFAFSFLFSDYIEKCFVKELTNLTWGIYLIHPLIINILIKILKINPLNYLAVVSIPTTCISVFVISGIIVWVLRKIIILKNIL